MPASIELRYEDSEGLLVEISPALNTKLIHVDVFDKGDYVCAAQCLTMEHAQRLARLLIGIEIQEDGAAWVRGPRSPARPEVLDAIRPHAFTIGDNYKNPDADHTSYGINVDDWGNRIEVYSDNDALRDYVLALLNWECKT